MGLLNQLSHGARALFGGSSSPSRLDSSDVQILESLSRELGSVREELDRMDAFANPITGLDDPDYDKRRHNRIVHGRVLGQRELEALYLYEEAARKVVDVPVHDAARTGFRVLVGDDEHTDKRTEPFKQALEELGTGRACKTGHRYTRQYGGGAIVMICDDHNRLDEPIDFETLGNIEALKVFHRFEIRPYKAYETDKLSARWGETELYQLHPTTPQTALGVKSIGYTFVHESRVIPFMGREVPEERRSEYEGWGQPHLEACYSTIENLGVLFDTAASKTQELIYDVHKVNGFADLIFGKSQKTPGKTALEERVRIVSLLKSIYRTVIIDAENEEWETKSIDFKGLRELFEVFTQEFSMGTDMPLTKILGQSPAGFNSADKTGERYYYDGVEEQQRDLWKPAIDRLVYVLSRAHDGPTDGEEIEEWETVFGDLERPSPKDQAEIRKLHTEADKIAIDLGVMDSAEGRRRYEEGEFNPSLTLERRQEVSVVGDEPPDGANGAKRQEELPNGAQMSAIKDVAVSMFSREIPPEAATGMAGFFLGLGQPQAEALFGLDSPRVRALLDAPALPADDSLTLGVDPPTPTPFAEDGMVSMREDYSETSVMLAFFPPIEWAKRCASYTDFPLDELHMTLVYLPDVDDELFEGILQTMATLAPTLPSMTFSINGPATFHNPSSIARVILPSAMGLNTTRAKIIGALEQRGQLTPQNHDFIPHLTLGYHLTEEPPDPELVMAPMKESWPTFNVSTLSIVRDGSRIDLDLGPKKEGI